MEFEEITPFGAHDTDPVAAQDQMVAAATEALRGCEAFFLVTIREDGEGQHLACGHTTIPRMASLLQATMLCAQDELRKLARSLL